MVGTENLAAYASSQKNASLFLVSFYTLLRLGPQGKWLLLLLVPFNKTLIIFLLTCSCLTLYLLMRCLILLNYFHLSLKYVPNI